MELSEWVAIARKHHEPELTQPALGAAIGCGKSNVWAWENGLHKPNLEQLKAISRLTGYSLKPLLDGEDLPGFDAPARLFSDLTPIESSILTKIRELVADWELAAFLEALSGLAGIRAVGSSPDVRGMKFEFHRVSAAQESPDTAAEAAEGLIKWNKREILGKLKQPTKEAATKPKSPT